MKNRLIHQLQNVWAKIWRSQFGQYAVFAVVFALIGAAVLALTHASAPGKTVETEDGTVANCGTKASDQSASSGQVIKFGSCYDITTPTNLLSSADGSTIPNTAYKANGDSCDVTTTTCANTIFIAPPCGTNDVVSVCGADTNSGTKASPFATIQTAFDYAKNHSAINTIVLRAGTYRGWYSQVASGATYATIKTLTASVDIQPYPHEQVWLDGTDECSQTGGSLGCNWQAVAGTSSKVWKVANWSTPTFCDTHYYDYPFDNQIGNATKNTTTFGPCSYWGSTDLPDGTQTAIGDPQMIFKDGVQLDEVLCPSSLSSLASNQFCYDEPKDGSGRPTGTGTLYVGSNPTGHKLELTTRPAAFRLGASAAGSRVRGIGVRRYASDAFESSNDKSTIYTDADSVTFENDVFYQNAGMALSGSALNGKITHSVFAKNGKQGLQWNGSHSGSNMTADNLDVESNYFTGNNANNYDQNCVPSNDCTAANIKMAHMNTLMFRNNIVENAVGAANGVWCDVSCLKASYVDNVIRNNGRAGITYEISDQAIIASNLVYGNGVIGIEVKSANTKLYNNTIVDDGSTAAVWLKDDSRSPSLSSQDQGPDTVGLQFVNNILAVIDPNNSEQTLLRVQGNNSNTPPNTTPSQFFSTGADFDYNSYYRPATNTALIKWLTPTNGSSGVTYTGLSPFRSGTILPNGDNLEVHGGRPAVMTSGDPYFMGAASHDYRLKSSSGISGKGAPIPADVACAIGLSKSTTCASVSPATLPAGQDYGALFYPGR